MTTPPTVTPKPTTAAEDVRLVEAALDVAQDCVADNPSPVEVKVIANAREAFARYRDHMATLTAFVAEITTIDARFRKQYARLYYPGEMGQAIWYYQRELASAMERGRALLAELADSASAEGGVSK